MYAYYAISLSISDQIMSNLQESVDNDHRNPAKHLTPWKKHRIWALMNEGMSSRQVGAQHGVSHVTVARIGKEGPQRPKDAVEKRGRPPKHTPQALRCLAHFIKTHKAMNAKLIAKMASTSDVHFAQYMVHKVQGTWASIGVWQDTPPS